MKNRGVKPGSLTKGNAIPLLLKEVPMKGKDGGIPYLSASAMSIHRSYNLVHPDLPIQSLDTVKKYLGILEKSNFISHEDIGRIKYWFRTDVIE